MRINCLSCGHRFDLGDAYDDYEGPVRCPTCRAVLEIRTQEGQVRAMRPLAWSATGPAEPSAPQPTKRPEFERAPGPAGVINAGTIAPPPAGETGGPLPPTRAAA